MREHKDGKANLAPDLAPGTSRDGHRDWGLMHTGTAVVGRRDRKGMCGFVLN